VTDANKADFVSLLRNIAHPCLLPINDVDYIIERGIAVVLRNWIPQGSLKDEIYKANPGLSYNRKYVRGRGLTLDRVQMYGKTVLEAMRFLHANNFPLGHVHSGNIFIVNNIACLSEYENALLGLQASPPRRSTVCDAMICHSLVVLMT